MTELNRKALGEELLRSREMRGWTLREAEHFTGVSKSVIGRAERGHSEGYVTADAVLILSYFYGFDPRNFVVFHVNTPSGQDLGARADG